MARYDKYDPINGGFRAQVAVDYPDADINKIFGVGINSAGQMVKGAGQTGIIGVVVNTQKPGRVGPQREVSVLDVMQVGCITDFGPSDGSHVPGVDFGVAGTPYYSDALGIITSAAVQNELTTVTVAGSAGTVIYTVTVNGVPASTSALAYNLAVATVQTDVQALANVGSGNLLVSGTPGAYVFTAAGTLLDADVKVSAVGSGGAVATTVVTEQGGASTYVGFTVEPDRLQVAVGAKPVLY